MTEHDEQAALVEYLHVQYPDVLFWSTPNGASLSSPRQMNKLKSEGLLPGVSDVIIFEQHGGYICLFIEMKRPDGGTVHENQLWFIAEIERRGAYGTIAAGFEEAKQIVDEYLSWPKTLVGLKSNEKSLPFEDNGVSVDVGKKDTTHTTALYPTYRDSDSGLQMNAIAPLSTTPNTRKRKSLTTPNGAKSFGR